MTVRTVSKAGHRLACALVFATGSLATLAIADNPAQAADKVYSPHVEQGEFELEYRFTRTFDNDANKDDARANKVAVGYGVTSYWATEVYGIWKRSPGGDMHFDATEWENRFQLTQPGEYWADLGFLVEYEHVRDRSNDADELAFGPLIQKEIGRTTNTINVVFERQLGPHRTVPNLNLTYRVQTKYRLMPEFEPAIEAFGEFGPMNHFNAGNEQEHSIGPAILGRLPLGFVPGNLRYDIGYQFGVTRATEDGKLKAILEYELPL